MDYTVLTRDQQKALARKGLADLEAQHFLADMMACINQGRAAEAKRQEVRGLEEAIARLREQYRAYLEADPA